MKGDFMEHWKVIDGTDGMLEVSSLGRVRSNLRDGRILKQQPDKKGYHRIRVSINRQKISFKVHREVAKAFIPNPLNMEQVNHIDGNKDNNSVENLEWVSNLENARHAIVNGLWSNVFAASVRVDEARKTPIISIDPETDEQVHFESVSAAEKYYDTRHISDVLNGKRAHAKGLRFVRMSGGDADAAQ